MTVAVSASDLTAPHVIAAEVLAAGGSHEEASKAAGVSKGTIYNWTRPGHPVAMERDRLVDEVRDSASRSLRSMAPLAVEGLRRVLTDPSSKGSEIVAAAREVLGRSGVAETTRSEVEVSTSWRDAAADVAAMDRATLVTDAFGASDADEE